MYKNGLCKILYVCEWYKRLRKTYSCLNMFYQYQLTRRKSYTVPMSLEIYCFQNSRCCKSIHQLLYNKFNVRDTNNDGKVMNILILLAFFENGKIPVIIGKNIFTKKSIKYDYRPFTKCQLNIGQWKDVSQFPSYFSFTLLLLIRPNIEY